MHGLYLRQRDSQKVGFFLFINEYLAFMSFCKGGVLWLSLVFLSSVRRISSFRERNPHQNHTCAVSTVTVLRITVDVRLSFGSIPKQR